MEGTLPSYRIYTLNAAGHVTLPPTTVEVEHDEAAIDHARQLQDGRDVEIWCGNRCVIHLAAPRQSVTVLSALAR
jgi:hypothetical protein